MAIIKGLEPEACPCGRLLCICNPRPVAGMPGYFHVNVRIPTSVVPLAKISSKVIPRVFSAMATAPGILNGSPLEDDDFKEGR
jgi:hypothetical protein